LFTPITKSPFLEQKMDEENEESVLRFSIPWTSSDENADTLVATSPHIDRRSERKESLGAGVVVREMLIKDLE
jgi:hypothetical protein